MNLFGSKYKATDPADAARCKELEGVLKGLKARLHSDPVRSSGLGDSAAGEIAMTMHMEGRGALEAEIEAIEQALNQACGFS